MHHTEWVIVAGLFGLFFIVMSRVTVWPQEKPIFAALGLFSAAGAVTLAII